jgi:hypothetical protein
VGPLRHGSHGETHVSDLEDDLDATADSVVQDAQRLIDVERQKQAAAGTTRAGHLGDEARRLSASIARKVVVEDVIADSLTRRAD